MINLNQYQTPIEDLHLEDEPEEIREQFKEAITEIPFVVNLIKADRPRVIDLPRDSKGRAIIDVCNPPILEDMDYFLPSRNNFIKTGKYCEFRPSSDPNSSFYKWMDIEIHRIWEGMTRPSDGMHVSGDWYFYHNYTQMDLTVQIEDTNAGDRVTGFPELWDGIFFRACYQEQAKYGGMYNNFKGGQHSTELARRGASKSYWAASQLARLFTCGENAKSCEHVIACITASTKEYLIKDGTLNKFQRAIDYLVKTTEFPSRRCKDSLGEMDWKMGVKNLDDQTEEGTLNEILGVSVNAKGNVGKLRGKRAAKILAEEAGSFPNFEAMYGVLKPSVQEGNISFGQMCIFGTAGDKASDFTAMKEFMYHPRAYNMYATPNVYDINGRKDFTFFFPGYLGRKGCYDKNGNSDVTKAILEILKNRYNIKHNTDDPLQILRAIAEDPLTPKEAIIQTTSAFFPKQRLSNRLDEIDSNVAEFDDVLVGTLQLTAKGKVEYIPTQTDPIRSYPLKGNKFAGACEIFKLPEADRNGKVYSGRYIGGIDPYDKDTSDTQSLGSIFILDLWTDDLVFEYTGRPDLAEDFYEICRCALLFYNARANYENNLLGIFTYFSRMNCLYLLCDTPEFLAGKTSIGVTGTNNNTTKGTRATEGINRQADELIKGWLITKRVLQVIDPETKESKEITGCAINNLKNRALIQELIAYSPEINVDRIRALGMLMLYRADILIKTQGNVKVSEETDDSYGGNDPFFKNNYKPYAVGI